MGDLLLTPRPNVAQTVKDPFLFSCRTLAGSIADPRVGVMLQKKQSQNEGDQNGRRIAMP